MGLRIKEWHVEPSRRASVGERLSEVESETRAWFEAKGQSREHAEFMRHIRKAYDRLATEPLDGELVDRVRGRILTGNNDSPLSHNQVDIATLLSLL